MSQEVVQVKHNEEVYELIPVKGKSLLASAFEQNIPFDYKCQKGNCTKCRIELLSGQELMNKPTPKEHEKLTDELHDGYRLACQTVPMK